MNQTVTIALAGNPNSGKTSLFNALTGARQHVGNYPGVTVEKKTGTARLNGTEFQVVDLPGTYSLTYYSPEELVARDFVVKERPDVVVDIVDAANLERNLYLAVQFLELGVPVVIALNMVDVAEKRGIVIDADRLAELLGVPVVPTTARTGRGKDEVLQAAAELAGRKRDWRPLEITYGADIDDRIERITGLIEGSKVELDGYPSRWLAIKCLEHDAQVTGLLEGEDRLSGQVRAQVDEVTRHIRATLDDEPESVIADHRYGHIFALAREVVKRRRDDRQTITDRIDRVVTNRLLGPIVLGLVIYALFWFVFTVGEYPMGWLESLFEALKGGVEAVLPEGFLRSLINSGIIDGVGGVLGFAPLILLMFFGIAVIEDSGYLARMAYVLDRALRIFGLHGGSTLALIVSGGISGGCAVPGVLATRTLKAPRERLATILVVPFMNCGAKVPVFALLIAAFFPKIPATMMMIIVILSWAFALVAALVLRKTVLRGDAAPFIMELPPYRMPTLRGLLIHTWERCWLYVKKAGTWILAVAIILWALMTFPQMPTRKVQALETRLSTEAVAGLLAAPAARKYFQSAAEVKSFDQKLGAHKQALKSGDRNKIAAAEKALGRHLALARALGAKKPPAQLAGVVTAVKAYRESRGSIDNRVAEAKLLFSAAGRIGTALETVTRPLGFTWQTNIALLGGFAAKEVIVSTLGTAYSLGEVDPEEAASLGNRLKKDRAWNPLVALSLIIFTILYVPCFVTVLMIRKEAGTRWALFSVAYTLVLAYVAALVVFQVGSLFGWGLT